jgi:hypothetical protein
MEIASGLPETAPSASLYGHDGVIRVNSAQNSGRLRKPAGTPLLREYRIISDDAPEPLGRIEAISNALRHAFPNRVRGSVRAGLPQAGENFISSVEDDGVEPPTERRPESFGMRSMESMARSLSRTLSVDGSQRSRIPVRFPHLPDQ